MLVVGKIYLGTSGWSYKDWVGPFYLSEEESKLAYYSKVFDTAEIDSTFYAYPTKGTVYGWLKYTRPEFVYSAKLSRLITHKKKLDVKQGVEADLERFCELMKPLLLEGKLACLLIQFPPGLKFDLKLLEDFLAILPKEFRFAVEFRHNSWLKNEVFGLLERYNVAYTVVDEPLLPPEVHVTADIAYFRWHGRGERPWYYYRYKKEELEPWIPKIEKAAEQTKAVYGYFNNHFHAYAVENCLQTLEMLGIITPEQRKVKERIENYFRKEAAKPPPIPPKRKTLAAYMPEQIEKLGFEGLIGFFMDDSRLKRARAISDDEISVEEISDKRIVAKVRDYHVLIDFENRLVLHDCADWSRCIPVKQFCKHIGKVMMMLPKEKAVATMRRICLELDKWEFKPYTG